MRIVLPVSTTRFSGKPTLPDWKSKVSDALQQEYQSWLTHQTDRNVSVLIALKDNVTLNPSLHQQLTTAGFTLQQDLSVVGVVTGKVNLSQIDQLASVSSIDFIEEDKPVRIPWAPCP